MKELKEALLVIDAQKVYASKETELYVEEYKSVIENINKLISLFQMEGKPIIYVRHIHEGRDDSGRMFDFIGEDVDLGFLNGTEDVMYIDELKIDKAIPEIVKKRYSSFEGTNLESLLNEKQANCVVITGFMTNYCCEATARQAHDKDYYVKFVLDATGAPSLPDLDSNEIKRGTAANIANGFGNVYTTEEMLQKNNYIKSE